MDGQRRCGEVCAWASVWRKKSIVFGQRYRDLIKYYRVPYNNPLGNGSLFISETETPLVDPSLGPTPDASNTGVVFYHGTVINIARSLESAKAVERERDGAMQKNEELELQLTVVKEQRDHNEKRKRRLEEELERFKKKLGESERNLKITEDEATQMKNALQDCKRYGERLVNMVEKVIPPPPAPKKDEKSEKKEETTRKDESITTATKKDEEQKKSGGDGNKTEDVEDKPKKTGAVEEDAKEEAHTIVQKNTNEEAIPVDAPMEQ